MIHSYNTIAQVMRFRNAGEELGMNANAGILPHITIVLIEL